MWKNGREAGKSADGEGGDDGVVIFLLQNLVEGLRLQDQSVERANLLERTSVTWYHPPLSVEITSLGLSDSHLFCWFPIDVSISASLRRRHGLLDDV